MRLFDAELLMPYLHQLKGMVYTPTGLKIKKFLIVPYGDEDLSVFIKSYTIQRWDEVGMLNRLFKDSNGFKIIAQFDLEYPNFNYVPLSDLNQDLLWDIIIDGMKRKYSAEGLISDDNLKDYFELQTNPFKLNFLLSKPLPSKVRNEITLFSALVFQTQ